MERNCQRTDEKCNPICSAAYAWTEPIVSAIATKRFQLDYNPQWDDISFTANEAVEREEDKRLLETLVGVEAWSDGRVRLWFE